MTKPDVQEAIEVLDSAMRSTGQINQMLEMPGVVAALEVVGCDIGARPAGAPMFEDIKPQIVSLRREPERLTIEFAASAAEQVAAFVAAEQMCCSDLMFNVITGERVVMQITATRELVDMVEGWMTPAP